jgi:hypothetical protein
MSATRHNRLLAKSGALKMRAGSLLTSANEEERFDGIVMLHEVVRLEEEALRLISAPSPETRLRFAIEKCGCLIDGGDPIGASAAWEDITLSSMDVAPAVAGSMRSRIAPKYYESQAALTRAMARRFGSPHVIWGLTSRPPDQSMGRARLESAARFLTRIMPGVARFWLWLAEHTRDPEIARRAIHRSRRLAGRPAPSDDRRERTLNLSPEEEERVRTILTVWVLRDGVSSTARRCELAISTVSGVLSGARRPGRRILARVSDAAGITVEQLLGREPLQTELVQVARPVRSERSSAA